MADNDQEGKRLREALELIAEYGVSDVRNFAKKVVSGLTASQALAQMIQENMGKFQGGDHEK
jgi:glycine cleavage system aminomethyltransferase T